MSTTNSSKPALARMNLHPFHGLIFLVTGFLVACSNSLPTVHYTPPPPTPIQFSGPAPDPTWMDEKTQQYTLSGDDPSRASAYARLAYLKKTGGYADSDPPQSISSSSPLSTHSNNSHSSTSTRNNTSSQRPTSQPSPTTPPAPNLATEPTTPSPEPPLAPAVTPPPVNTPDDSPYMNPRSPIQPHNYTGDTDPSPSPTP